MREECVSLSFYLVLTTYDDLLSGRCAKMLYTVLGDSELIEENDILQLLG